MRRDENGLLTARETQRIDLLTQEDYRVSGDVLMENAGQKAWAYLRDAYLPALVPNAPRGVPIEGVGPIVFVAGSGKNGGDVLVIARQCLVEGVFTPMIITVRDSLKGAMERQWNRLAAFGAERAIWEGDRENCRRIIESAAVIVDGITGTGISGPLRLLEATLVSAINDSEAKTVAIDVPSGMRDGGAIDEPTIIADVTISTGYRKRFLYAPARRERAGTIVWVDPGFPPGSNAHRAALVNGETYPPERIGIRRIATDAHKGTRGRLTVVAGGDGTEGAALLCGIAAARTGVGMVRVVTTPRGCDAGLQLDPGIMWVSNDPDAQIASWSDAVVIGPGWTGAAEDDLCSVMEAVAASPVPIVLDAAALRSVECLLERGTLQLPVKAEQYIVCTPHPGELAGLAGVPVETVASEPFSVLDRAAGRIAAAIPHRSTPTIVLKAAATIVRDQNGRFSVVDGRCRGLGVAGSGDVLAGMIGGYMATPLVTEPDARDALVVDAIVEHLQRGRRLTQRVGAFSAADLAEESIPPGAES